MIIDDNISSSDHTSNSDKLRKKPHSWKFDFPFRAERIVHSPPPIMKNRDSKSEGLRISRTNRINADNALSPSAPFSNPTTPTTPSHIKHDYLDSKVYYVSRDFFAATSDHLSVFLDDELELIEELPGGAWTRVKERDSQQIGLIPTEILESGAERLAKDNKTTNQDAIRVMSCRAGIENGRRRKGGRKRVSFCESEPDVVHYPPDHTNDHSIFPFTLEDDLTAALATCEATSCDSAIVNETAIETATTATTANNSTTNDKGFLKKLFRRKTKPNSVLATLSDFEKYPDHLIRVYTGNLDPLLHAYKTFIVDESLTFAEFTHMVLSTFDLDADGFLYELNLVNHLTAEVVALDLDFTIEQVIELTKREGLAFSKRMPRELRRAQRGALKRLKESSAATADRDKSTDYVTPFKFVINRVYNSIDNVPIYVHVSLAYAGGCCCTSDLIISSLFPETDTPATNSARDKKKWYQKLVKNKKHEDESNTPRQALHRLQIYTKDPLHTLIHHLLETLQCPQTLPGIAFEASLPAIHDAIELPLPINMPVGDVMKIRPKLDQSQQVIIIRPVIVNAT